MTRNYLVAITAMVTISAVSVITGTGCSSTGVGDPCVPEQEYATDFTGFDYHEVNIESKSFQCLTRLCLVNHFQGRVSCPYGQNASATAAFGLTGGSFTCDGKHGSPSEQTQCCIPGINQPVIGDQDICPTPNGPGTSTSASCPTAPTPSHSQVPANCSDRTADKAVYCSCRCANTDGKTDDGANYCTCPDGYSCDQLVASIGAAEQGLTGAYCVKKGTEYSNTSCSSAPCDPTAPSGSAGYCGPVNSVH